jgi:hypothetical protein
LACKNSLPEVAIELIKTGQSKPDHIGSDNNTALIWACHNKLPEVAVELIKILIIT